MSSVLVRSGFYRNAEIKNTIFKLVKPYVDGKKGGFITVDPTGVSGFEGKDKIRIRVEKDSFDIIGSTLAPIEITETVSIPVESDDEVIARIGERFEILHEITRATTEGAIRAAIVVGPPGVGKSFGVLKELEKASLFDMIGGLPLRYQVVKGSLSPIGLYKKLYDYSEEGCVLAFDDADNILFDDISLNLLKAALDSSNKRTIQWNSESRVLRDEGVPNMFDFKGSIIFITNINFDTIRSGRLKDHLAALKSRCHYLDLTINSARDKFMRVKQIARTGELFPQYGMSKEQENEIIDFMEDNQNKLNEMSLRMAIKLADLRKMSATRWQQIARITCMKG